MKLKKFILLGNGFTIDFLSQIKKLDNLDVINLFKNGENLAWPENNQLGFLSHKYCPNLWNLGIRPYLDKDTNYRIFEDIITCANMANDLKLSNIKQKIYLLAYKELTNYLKFLFISYNKYFDFELELIEDWGWFKYFNDLNNDTNVIDVTIVTLNYDIFLEKILEKMNIKFNISGFNENTEYKFNVIKPHGSISFRHKQELDISAYSIKYELESLESQLEDFYIDNDLDYSEKFPIISALLPPAGDSSRYKLSWAEKLRDKVLEKAKEVNNRDDVIICGISYWHVDRQELDKYFVEINPDANIFLINPNPPSVFNAVLTTLFKNVIVYKKSDNLGKQYE